MNCKKLTLNDSGYPKQLAEISDPPKSLYYLGAQPADLLANYEAVAIVGSRKVSSYGRLVTDRLASKLTDKGVIIVSGLALGVDGLAHQSTVRSGGIAIAVLPCGLDRIYPSTHTNLAKQIIEGGGTILSEYPPGTEPMKHHFIARNRIISGISRATLITEAAENSGSLHTAQFALEQGREVLAVPGNITSPVSVGTNNLIKMGAIAVTNPKDIFESIGIQEEKQVKRQGASPAEAIILELLGNGITDLDLLLADSGLGQQTFNQTLTMLEIADKIRPNGNGSWVLS